MRMQFIRRIYVAVSALVTMALLLGACSTTRYVGEGEYLLRRVRIEIDSATTETPLPSDLISYISQKPNKRIFGLADWGLGLYNMSNIKSNGWIHRQLRLWGEAPVIYSPSEAQNTLGYLTTVLYNRGYLRAQGNLLVDTIGSKKLRVTYHLTPGPLYRIARHQEFVRDSVMNALLHPEDTLQEQLQFGDERYTSLLAPGAPLSPERMQAERRRITQILRNRGYWDFREGHIRFEVDTLAGLNDIWVHTHIDSMSPVYRIGQVRMRHAITSASDAASSDSTSLSGISITRSNHHKLRWRILNARNHIRPSQLYSQYATQRTYTALSDLDMIRSVAVQYTVDSSAIAPTLNVDVTTTPEPSMELSGEFIGTHSGGHFGTNASLSLLHNNVFYGSEQLRLLGRIGYEELSSLSSNHINYGGEATLTFPRLIVPFYPLERQRQLRGRTSLSISYDYLTRPEFRRSLLSASWGYSWMNYRNRAFRPSLKLLEVDYMHFGYLDDSFISSVPLYTRMLSYRDQFVVSSSLTLRYNTTLAPQHSLAPWQHSFRLHLQSAGNALYGLSSLLGAQRDEYGAFSLMNINFAQFLRAEFDYSGQYRFGGKNAFAYRAAAALLIPYGNSRILPIDLRYFSGGASSVRGWSVRSLGPGSMPHAVGTSIFHQVGDIKLDLNAELRLRIAPSWEIATFIDAGNIWTAHADDSLPNAHFSLKRLPREIALATGLGLRWDFDFFLLRLDAGLKLYDPQANPGARWGIGTRSLSKLAALHFALGYPF